MQIKTSHGFSLVETLVTLLVMGIGMLGLVGMQVAGVKSNQSAYFKTQASILASDIVDRLRFNSTRAIAGDYDGFSTENSQVETPACATSVNGCNEDSIVALDMAEWTELVAGAEDSSVLLPDATGTITRGAGNLFTISIAWNEVSFDAETNERNVVQQTYSMNVSL